MNKKSLYNEFINTQHNLYLYHKEIAADIETPVSAFYALQEEPTGKSKRSIGFLLESVEMGTKLGEYSFLGFEPEMEFIAKKNKVTFSFQGETEEFLCENPLKELKKVLNAFKEIRNSELPPFSIGLVGYLSYDSIRYFEKIPDIKPDKLNFPDVYLILPKIVVAFDHIKQKLILISYSYNEKDNKRAIDTIKKYEERLYYGRKPGRIVESSENKINLVSNFKKENFIDAVNKAKEYIKNGDIFQVVLSQRFKTEVDIPPFDIYRKLRMINPSPYMFYIDLGEFKLIGSSPEVMVKRRKDELKDEIIIRPIAGTRKRGKNKEEDDLIAQELLQDKKELAEHTMLLDLARNDIGKVSEYSSVRVENIYHIEKFSHVMHIVSDVIGKPKENIDAIDIIGAAFPAGTVSGAPKIRSMEIIEELEPEKRGIYAGAIGYIDFNGNVDSCIAIRTIIYNDGIAYIQAGAGIVYDSLPENEYQETINKAKALIKALI